MYMNKDLAKEVLLQLYHVCHDIADGFTDPSTVNWQHLTKRCDHALEALGATDKRA